jgi:nitrogen fixation protein NifU and related proteins
MKLDEIYQEVILDHHKHPRCQGCIDCPDASCALRNPLCGDHIDLRVNVEDQKVSKIMFSGHGCAISQASASMMSDLCSGKTLEQVGNLAAYFRSMMRGEKSGEELEELGDAVALEGVKNFSARVKCAMLAWEALEKCVADLLGKGGGKT